MANQETRISNVLAISRNEHYRVQQMAPEAFAVIESERGSIVSVFKEHLNFRDALAEMRRLEQFDIAFERGI